MLTLELTHLAGERFTEGGENINYVNEVNIASVDGASEWEWGEGVALILQIFHWAKAINK